MGDLLSLNTARAVKLNDNTLLSPVECLEDAAREIRDGKRNCNAILCITLNTDNNAYNVGFYASNLTGSQQIALMEVHKSAILKLMEVGQE